MGAMSIKWQIDHPLPMATKALAIYLLLNPLRLKIA
jgi:hypothetical protein